MANFDVTISPNSSGNPMLTPSVPLAEHIAQSLGVGWVVQVVNHVGGNVRVRAQHATAGIFEVPLAPIQLASWTQEDIAQYIITCITGNRLTDTVDRTLPPAFANDVLRQYEERERAKEAEEEARQIVLDAIERRSRGE